MTNNIVNEFNLLKLFFDVNDSGEPDYLKQYIYNVPKYQRTYKWNTGLAEILFNDLTEQKDEQYNFGFITRAILPKSLFEYDIVDGQQRLITTYICLLAMYRVVHKKDSDVRNYKKLHEHVNTKIPFKTNKKTKNALESIYKNATEQKRLTSDNIINENIVENYRHIILMLLKKFRKKDSAFISVSISDMYEKLCNQTIFLLTYKKHKSALESFISINMKSKDLDSFEILSALLLSKLSEENYGKYRDKLDSFYDNAIKIKSFSSFESYMFSVLWARDGKYNYYCINPSNLKKEVRLNMPNHYVENINLPEGSTIDLIEEISDVTVKYLSFEKNGMLDWVDSLIDPIDISGSRVIKKQLKVIEYLMKSKNSKLYLKTLTVVQRYILALISILRSYTMTTKEYDNSSLVDITRELIFVLLEQHVLAIVGNKRISSENPYILSANSIKKYRNLWVVDRDDMKNKLFNLKKIPEINGESYILKPSKMFSLNIIYQIESSIKRESIGSKETIFTTPIYETNKEHYFIDKKRAKKMLYKNSLGYNCFDIPSDINTLLSTASKSLSNKINLILSKKEIEYRYYNLFYRINIIAKEVLDNINEKDVNLTQSEFKKILKYYMDDSTIIVENFKIPFAKFHSVFLEKFMRKFLADFYDTLDVFIYDNPKIFDRY